MKRKIRFLGLLFTFFLGIFAVLYFTLSEKQGTADTFSQFPEFGEILPNIHVDELKYSYFPSTRRLLATAKITRSEFIKMCKDLGDDPLPYPNGFEDGVVTDIRYAPTNGAVYLIEKAPYSGARTILRVYFQPSGDLSGESGRLFVQVLN